MTPSSAIGVQSGNATGGRRSERLARNLPRLASGTTGTALSTRTTRGGERREPVNGVDPALGRLDTPVAGEWAAAPQQAGSSAERVAPTPAWRGGLYRLLRAPGHGAQSVGRPPARPLRRQRIGPP